MGVALAVLASPAAAERFEGSPPWRASGRVAFTLDTATRPDSTGTVLEIYLRIPPATLRQAGRDEGGIGLLQATVRVRGGSGSRRVDTSQELGVPVNDRDTLWGQGRVVTLRWPVSAGTYRISAKLEDVFTRKRGLIYSTRSTREFAQAEGEVLVPGAQAGRYVSDVAFQWPGADGTTAPDAPFWRSLVPNPERLYGLWAPRVRASFVARGPDDQVRPWHWLARVYDDSAHVVAQKESTGVASRWLDAACDFDLSSEPSGGYVLEVKAWQEGDPAALLRRANFSIAWRPDTWSRSATEVTDDVHFLLEAESEEAFLQLQPGEQERYLDRFWALRDPTPETATNESYETFRRRIEHANRTYTRFGLDKGMFSDMGRTFIRYGEPSEVLNQVVPTGDDDLVRVLEQLSADEDRAVGVGAKRGDQRSWEVWIYEGNVPRPIDADPTAPSSGRGWRRLVFLFVDDTGTGNYTLRYSTE